MLPPLTHIELTCDDGVRLITRQEFEGLADSFREGNAIGTERGDRYSRECVPCRNANPLVRSVAMSCGHLVCSKCAEGATKCPICETPSEFCRLYEEISRECVICCEMPHYRSFFSQCGHIICLACSVQLSAPAIFNRRLIRCPLCRTEQSSFEALREEKIEAEIKRRKEDLEALMRKRKQWAKEKNHAEEVERGEAIEKKEIRALHQSQRQARKNRDRNRTTRSFICPNKTMIRVNQPLKQQNYCRR